MNIFACVFGGCGFIDDFIMKTSVWKVQFGGGHPKKGSFVNYVTPKNGFFFVTNYPKK
jgi:hypothetical protein